ncbi:hypothetical protein [Sporosalibacterium faouarense]|uniref:hypothetical protein n=1 Tax=Sporosalibacterium faouarense TaxID=516123 RepID=UPI00192BBB04|nr:hypothetical protein [Sporosalibacterium faouarense]
MEESKGKKIKKILYILLAIGTVFFISFLIYTMVQYLEVARRVEKQRNHIEEIKEFQRSSEIESIVSDDVDSRSNKGGALKEKHRITSGGIDISNEIYIENSHMLLEYFTYEEYVKIKENISKVILLILPELNDLHQEEIEGYFNENYQDIANHLGVDTLENFHKYLDRIRILKNKEIDRVYIDMNSIESYEGISYFDLRIIAKDGVKETFKTKVVKIEEIFNVMVTR